MAVALWAVALVASGYAESFSNRPTAGDMSEYVAQGIICGNAVRERELAVSSSQNLLPYCGTWQPYVASLQQELETLAPIYIDHDNGPLTDAGNAFLHFTLDNWRATAGLNVSGFRRSTDGTTFYYGQMQAGDIIGSWIFEDLQKGVGALKMLSLIDNFISVKNLFPGLITTEINYAGSISQVGSQYYGAVDLGSPSSYDVVWNNQGIFSQGGTEYVSMGRVEDEYISIANDSKSYGNPNTEISYTVNLEFADSDYVKVLACIVRHINAISYSSSFTDSTISTHAVLPAENAPVGSSMIMWDCLVAIEPPFTNAGN